MVEEALTALSRRGMVDLRKKKGPYVGTLEVVLAVRKTAIVAYHTFPTAKTKARIRNYADCFSFHFLYLIQVGHSIFIPRPRQLPWWCVEYAAHS